MSTTEENEQVPAAADGLRSRAARWRWFHAIDFGEFQTAGRFPEGTAPNHTLFPAIDLLRSVDLEGRDCLDIGTVHGLMAFGMAKRGGNVTATDVMDQVSPPFEIAREALGLDVEYRTETTFETILQRLEGRRFDVVVCAGVLYHMLDPFDAVIKARRLLRPNGLLVLESAYSSRDETALMHLNSETPVVNESTTYWVPSRLAMIGMLKLAGLDPVADRYIAKPDRLAILARNGSFDDVRDRTALTQQMHERGLYATEIIEEPEGAPSDVRYDGPEDSRELDWKAYVPDWPPHPQAMTDVVGR